MAFAETMMGFPSDLVSFSIKLPSKRLEKIRVTFFTGETFVEIEYNLKFVSLLMQEVTEKVGVLI